MKFRSEKMPADILTDALPASIQYGRGIAASELLSALRKEGWIVVRHDAIRLAQAHARADNDPVQSYERQRPNMRAKAA